MGSRKSALGAAPPPMLNSGESAKFRFRHRFHACRYGCKYNCRHDRRFFPRQAPGLNAAYLVTRVTSDAEGSGPESRGTKGEGEPVALEEPVNIARRHVLALCDGGGAQLAVAEIRRYIGHDRAAERRGCRAPRQSPSNLAWRPRSNPIAPPANTRCCTHGDNGSSRCWLQIGLDAVLT